MKLRPTQVVGLVAIVVFGGILVTTLMKGKRDPDLLPSGVRISDLPSPTAPEIKIPPIDLSGVTPPAGLGEAAAINIPGQPDHLNVGSQAAKDDLYCSGVTGVEFDMLAARDPDKEPKQDPDAMSKMLDAHNALDDAGIAKLKAEGVTDDTNSAGFSLAYWDKAKQDYAAKTLRIPVDTCVARAAALPKPN